MNRITNEQREAIVRNAIAQRDALLDCAGGMPCSDCPDKRKCQRGCIRKPEFVSTAYHALERLLRLHDEHLNAEPPLEERGEAEYKRWAYAMSDAWDSARAVIDGVPPTEGEQR
jgi:hypothetical protein